MKYKLLIMSLMTIMLGSSALAQKTFGSLAEFWVYAQTKNLSSQTYDIKVLQTKRAKLAAELAVYDPSFSISGSFTDNTKLPVNLFPAEIFGGNKGTFRTVQMGVQYNTGFSQSVELKLLNMEGRQNLKLADVNINLSETDAQRNRKSLYESIASAYYNIVQLNTQLKNTEQAEAISDTLRQLIEEKYRQGIAKQQDLNDSRVNQLTLRENRNQIRFLLEQNHRSLKILTDIAENEPIVINEEASAFVQTDAPLVLRNGLDIRQSQYREQYAAYYLTKTKKALFPVFSLVANNAYNAYNNDFRILGGQFINSNYVGLKLNFMLNAHYISNRKSAEFDYQIAQKSTEQAQIKADLTTQQLQTDWAKALSQYHSFSDILAIQQDTYQKNKNLYAEGLLGFERVLNSLNAVLNAQYNVSTAKVSVELIRAKIQINNQLQ